MTKNAINEVTEFDLELAEYDGYTISCTIHGLTNKKLDIELSYSSDLECEADNIRRLVTAIIVTALEESDNDETNKLQSLKAFTTNPCTV